MCFFIFVVVSDEVRQNRKLLNPDQRCKRGRITIEREKAQNVPRCHNYL